MSTGALITADLSVLIDPTDPPMTVPPSGPFSVVPVAHNVTTDRLAPAGPGLGPNALQNGIVRIDQTVGGETTARNIVTWAAGLPPRPAAFLRENWQGQPMPLNRLQGRVGYQNAAQQLATRVSTQDATIIPTGAETAAAATHPAIVARLDVHRGGRWSRA